MLSEAFSFNVLLFLFVGYDILCRDVRIVVSRSLVGQSQMARHGVVQIPVCIRCFKRDSFVRTVDYTGVTAYAGVVPDRMFI